MLQREKEKAALVMELRGALTKDEEHSLKSQILEKLERTKAFQRATEDGNRRCLAMEEAFLKLKQITGVSSLVDMHEKFSSQVGDKSILLMEVKEAELKLEAIKATQLRQLATFEEMQSSNSSNFNNHDNRNNDNQNDHIDSCGSSSGKDSIRLPSNGIRLPSSGMGDEYFGGGKACTTSTRVGPTSKTDITPTHSAKSDTNTNTNSNISSSSSNNNSNNNSPRNLISSTPRSTYSLLQQQQNKLHDRTDRSMNDAGNGNGSGSGMKWDRSGSAGGNDTVHRVRAANDQYVLSPISFISPFLLIPIHFFVVLNFYFFYNYFHFYFYFYFYFYFNSYFYLIAYLTGYSIQHS